VVTNRVLLLVTPFALPGVSCGGADDGLTTGADSAVAFRTPVIRVLD
jgi:hypothetical protein